MITDAHVINLDNRMKKFTNVKCQFQTINSINIIRFPAIIHKKGHIGCSMSHMKILKDNENLNKCVLILEDDVCLFDVNSFNDRWNKIKNYLNDNLGEWDIFLGGSSHINKHCENDVKIINNDLGILSVKTATTAHFIYYNKNIIKKIIDLDPNKTIMDWLHAPIPDIRVWVCAPLLAIQSDCYSDIDHKYKFVYNDFMNTNNKLLWYVSFINQKIGVIIQTPDNIENIKNKFYPNNNKKYIILNETNKINLLSKINKLNNIDVDALFFIDSTVKFNETFTSTYDYCNLIYQKTEMHNQYVNYKKSSAFVYGSRQNKGFNLSMTFIGGKTSEFMKFIYTINNYINKDKNINYFPPGEELPYLNKYYNDNYNVFTEIKI